MGPITGLLKDSCLLGVPEEFTVAHMSFPSRKPLKLGGTVWALSGASCGKIQACTFPKSTRRLATGRPIAAAMRSLLPSPGS